MKNKIAAAGLFLASSFPAWAGPMDTQVSFAIEAQSLESALIAFSEASGVQVMASSDMLANKTTQGITRKVSSDNALDRILSGTGLTYRVSGESTVTIVPKPAATEAASSSSPAQGEPDGPFSVGKKESDGVLDQIVVTAQKRAQALMDVPLSVTAFRGEVLEERGLRGVSDFIGLTPGVSVRPSNNGLASIQIRGISTALGDGTVGFYLDEIPFSVVSATISPNMRSFDLERVEVLRGPQGTLYGQGSMGGTVKLITKAPELNAYGAKVDLATGVKHGGDMNYLANGAINLPLVEDKLAVRLVASYQENGGFLDDLTSGREDVNTYKSRNYRAKVLLTPNDDLRITASAWLQRDVSKFSSGGFDDGTLIGGPGGDDVLHVDGDTYNAVIEYDLDFAHLTSSTSYMEFGIASNNYSLIASPGATTTVAVDSDSGNDVFAQELRLVSSGEGPFNWSVGGLYTDVKLDAKSFVDVSTVIPDFVTVGTVTDVTGGIDSETWAVFGEASMLLFDGFVEPLIGLRYFEDKRTGLAETTVSSTLDFVNNPPPDMSSVVTTIDGGTPETFTTFNPRFNVAFHLSEDWLAYVNVAKGFRSGGGNGGDGIALAASLGLDAKTYTPDKVWSYEVGTKAELFDRKLALEAALYYNDWKDIQMQSLDSITGTAFVINAGDAHTKGLEFGVTYQPIEGLTLQGSGNINESKLDEINPALGPVLYYQKGDRLDYIPKLQLNASATYKWDLGWEGDYEGFVFGSVNHNSAMTRTTIDGVFTGDPITSVNLRVGAQNERWGVFLYVDNLLNEDDRVTNFIDNTGERIQPRVIGLNVRANFY